MCGAGCAGAHDAVIELARTLNAPIVHSLRGKEYVEYDNPFDVGMTGLIGFASGYAAMKECDTLLLLGTDFPYRQFYPEKARVAQVDIRPESLGNRCRLDIGVVGDVGDTIAALLPRLKPRTDRSLPRRRPRPLPQGARRSRQAGRGRPGRRQDPSAVCRPPVQRARRRRRDLHLRRRHANRCGPRAT